MVAKGPPDGRLRQSPIAESRKWGVYYVVGLILKSYFRVSYRCCLHPYMHLMRD